MSNCKWFFEASSVDSSGALNDVSYCWRQIANVEACMKAGESSFARADVG